MSPNHEDRALPDLRAMLAGPVSTQSPGSSSDPAERPGPREALSGSPTLAKPTPATAALFRSDNDPGCGPAMTGTAARSNRFSLRDSE
jgi:hypothetical protein